METMQKRRVVWLARVLAAGLLAVVLAMPAVAAADARSGKNPPGQQQAQHQQAGQTGFEGQPGSQSASTGGNHRGDASASGSGTTGGGPSTTAASGGGQASGGHAQTSGGDEAPAKNPPSTPLFPQPTTQCGPSQHPSGKDRCNEPGGVPQGQSPSAPDNDGRGPERDSTVHPGIDKPGFGGGDNLNDQDGNNGCGNDQDFEDDDEGWCGNKPKRHAPAPPPAGGGGGRGEQPGGGQPTITLPTVTQPTITQPAVLQPMVVLPTVTQPTIEVTPPLVVAGVFAAAEEQPEERPSAFVAAAEEIEAAPMAAAVAAVSEAERAELAPVEAAVAAVSEAEEVPMEVVAGIVEFAAPAALAAAPAEIQPAVTEAAPAPFVSALPITGERALDLAALALIPLMVAAGSLALARVAARRR